jgi:rhodanese-related sulfurtransferase
MPYISKHFLDQDLLPDRRRTVGFLLATGAASGIVSGIVSGVGPAHAQATAQAMRGSKALSIVEAKIAQSFADIAHITPAELAARLAQDRANIVMVDVRTPAEAAVSRLAGAVQVDPDARSTHAIVAAAAGNLSGKTLIAYCSIGLRSARLLTRINGSLRDRGAVELLNLSGGLFRWRNERRPLVTPSGAPTTAIHPYSTLWRQFLLDDPAGQ